MKKIYWVIVLVVIILVILSAVLVLASLTQTGGYTLTTTITGLGGYPPQTDPIVHVSWKKTVLTDSIIFPKMSFVVPVRMGGTIELICNSGDVRNKTWDIIISDYGAAVTSDQVWENIKPGDTCLIYARREICDWYLNEVLQTSGCGPVGELTRRVVAPLE